MNAILDNAVKLEVGQPAPDFTLTNQNNQEFKLSQALQKGKVMLVFYPTDFTPGCTKQLCGIRDVYKEYADLGVKVVGVNKGTAQSHQKFIAEYGYQFDILSDPDNKIRDSYGAIKLFFNNITTKRGVVLVGQNGLIEYIFWGQQDNQTIIDFIKREST
jgi:thioredoxin-dependent peroxiredoxin